MKVQETYLLPFTDKENAFFLDILPIQRLYALHRTDEEVVQRQFFACHAAAFTPVGPQPHRERIGLSCAVNLPI